MKALIFLKILVFFVTTPYIIKAQTFAVAADKMNVAYIGITNPITVAVENCGCEELIVTVDQGEIKKVNGCEYCFIVTKSGLSKLTIRKKGSNKVLGHQTIRCKVIPAPVALVGTRKRTDYPLQQFKVQEGVSILLENVEFDIRFIVKDFNVRVIRKGKVVFENANSGNRFNDASKSFFSTLIVGDKVELYNIISLGPDNIGRTMNRIIYNMVP